MAHKGRRRRALAGLIGLLSLLVLGGAAHGAVAVRGANGSDFVKQAGPELRLHGKLFRFAGTNNYYLMYKSHFMVDDVLQRASAQHFNVVRTWGWLDIGNQDGSNSIRGKQDGVYFHYWDPVAGKPAFNDGADGLQHLDYVIAKAGQLGLKLVIPFTNNWNDFGGMDQYVKWRDLSSPGQGPWYHDSFYTDPTIRQWFKDWIGHLLNHTNSITGVKYKDDPTIMTWELGNEPRCTSAGAYVRGPSCSTQTLVSWANEMSTYVKSIDPKHLVSVGDEGFYCHAGATHWTENCGEGVDTEAFTALPNIDVMSFHLYPDSWGTDVAWGTQWIKSHFAAARALGKPAMLGEFGLGDKTTRNPSYKLWLDTVFQSGGAGALYWILSGLQDDNTLYPDYDGFTVYCPSPVCTTIGNFAQQMSANAYLTFPPVADDDTAITEFETPVDLPATANDIAYSATVSPSTLDLDPAAAGRQTSVAVTGGTFSSSPDGTITFTPESGFSGKATATYTVQDSAGRTSNAARLTVTVKPSPTAPLVLFDFEDGVDGWAQASWQTGGSSVAQVSGNATSGTHSLQIASQDDGYWFGAPFSTPVDLTGRTELSYDLTSVTPGTSAALALQVGPSWDWCQITNAGWFTTPQTLTFDLTSLSSSCASELNQVHQMYIAVNAGSTVTIDDVRAQ